MSLSKQEIHFQKSAKILALYINISPSRNLHKTLFLSFVSLQFSLKNSIQRSAEQNSLLI